MGLTHKGESDGKVGFGSGKQRDRLLWLGEDELPLTCSLEEYLASAAVLDATQVYSPEWPAVTALMLRRLENESSSDTFTGNRDPKGLPSLSHRIVSGGSPCATPQMTRVRAPSGRPSNGKANDSILGGTVEMEQSERIGAMANQLTIGCVVNMDRIERLIRI